MQKKVWKPIAIISGIILIWTLNFFIFGESTKRTARPTLEFWSVFDTTDEMSPMLDDFTRATGIRVNYRSFADLAEYRETLLFELAAGKGPDVAAIHAEWLPKYRDLLVPLPEELGYSQKDLQKYFLDGVVESVVVDDEIFGLPMYLDTLAIFYNKTFFRNVLSKPYATPEAKWSGIREDVIGLTVPDAEDPTGFFRSGIALGRADNITRGVDIFYNLYLQFGGADLPDSARERAKDDNGKNYNPLSATLEFLTTFSRNSANREYCWSAEMGADPEKEISEFARGRVAMIAGYSYYFDEIKKAIKTNRTKNPIDFGEVAIAPFPQIYDTKKIAADFFTLSVTKFSEHPLESWRLILELTSRDSQSKYFEQTNKTTSRRDLVEEQKDDSIFGVFAEQSVFADVVPMSDDELFDSAVAETLDQISDGERTTTEAARTLSKFFRDTAEAVE